MPAGNRPLLSIITHGRNDNYGRNYAWRLSTSLNQFARSIRENGVERDAELILVDWGSETPLTEVLSLDDSARAQLRVVHVPAATAARFNRDSDYSLVHPPNVGSRFASGRYVSHWDSDAYVPAPSLRALIDGLRRGSFGDIPAERALLWASRRELPEALQEGQPGLAELARRLALHDAECPHSILNLDGFGGGAVGYVIPSALWHACRGQDERLIYRSWLDLEIHTRFMTEFAVGDLDPHGCRCYHLQHDRKASETTAATGKPRRMNPRVLPRSFAPNGPLWGLAGETILLRQWRAGSWQATETPVPGQPPDGDPPVDVLPDPAWRRQMRRTLRAAAVRSLRHTPFPSWYFLHGIHQYLRTVLPNRALDALSHWIDRTLVCGWRARC